MRELLALVITNLKIQYNLIFGEEKQKLNKKFFNVIFMIILCEISIGASTLKAFNTLHLNNNQSLIFNLIIATELVLIIANSFVRVINDFYLASDWKEVMIYPIKVGNFLLSKCVSIYIINILIAVFTLVPLIVYGILDNANMYYYICLLGYQILIPIMIIGYIALISLTLVCFTTLINKLRDGKRINKFILLINVLVAVLTYILLKPALSSNIKVSKLIFSIFFSENAISLISTISIDIIINFIISIFIIILLLSNIYFMGESVYILIMKSETFSSARSKRIEKDVNEYEFNVKGIIISNIIRDVKVIVRTPLLLTKCIGGSIAYSLIFFIILVIFGGRIRTLLFDIKSINCIFVITWILLSTAVNFTPITSFSREGRGLSQFSVFPIYSKDFLLSKIYVGLLSNILNFIVANVFMAIIATDLGDFILLEIIAISYIVLIVLIQIRMDSKNLNLKWIEIKDLFQLEYTFKNFMPLVVITIFIYAYLINVVLIANVKQGEMLYYSTFIFFMLIAIIGSFISLRKIKINYRNKIYANK